jgi:hypothetical protein
MAKDLMGPDFAMMGMLCLMMLPGDRVVSVKKALEGFSNEGFLLSCFCSICLRTGAKFPVQPSHTHAA